jgi:hypothetical protein
MKSGPFATDSKVKNARSFPANGLARWTMPVVRIAPIAFLVAEIRMHPRSAWPISWIHQLSPTFHPAHFSTIKIPFLVTHNLYSEC